MNPATPCPDIQKLQQFVLGRVLPAELEPLAAHVEHCSACINRLHALTAQDPFGEVGPTPSPPAGQTISENLLDLLKQRFKKMDAHDEHAMAAASRVIAFACDHCGKKLKVKDELAGKNVKCSGCGKATAVPLVTGASPGQAKPSSAHVRSGSKAAADQAAPAELTEVLSPPQAAGELGRLGRYRITRILGSGGMGVVYEAEDPLLERQVAVKVARPGLHEPATEVERFLREARAAATVHHANICPVYEVGEENGTYYIVMGLVPGTSLAQFLKARKQPLPGRQAALLVRKLALALDAAHAKGIIHRDLKPGNIMLDRERREPVIMDFGLARRLESADAQLTHAGMILGTPAYMAPEQALGDMKDVGPASDIYSLGVILYELLAGRPPYIGKPASVLGEVLFAPLDPPSKHREGIDSRLEQICLKAMARDLHNRHGSMKALADDLGTAARELKAEPASKTVLAATAPATGKAKKSEKDDLDLGTLFDALQTQEKTHAARFRRLVYLGGGGLTAAVLLLAALFVFTRTPTVAVVINVGVDLADKTLRFILDGRPISAEALAVPLELAVGEHELIVQRGEDVVKRLRFLVQGGPTPTVEYRQIRDTGKLEDDASYRERVAALPDEKKLEAAVARLKELNPGFNGKVTARIEQGVATELAFTTDQVTDISPVQVLAGLRNLNCNSGRGRLADLSPLKGMKLTQLFCNGTLVADLSPLEGMPLTYLQCNNSKVRDLTPLKGMPLTSLWCSGTMVTDLTPLQSTPLAVLHCSHTPLANLSSLKGMKLTQLYCQNTNVSDLSPLKGMKLTYFDCSGTKVVDLSALKGMPLVSLTCYATPVADLSPLEGMPLATLWCSSTKVVDLTPLREAPLTTLQCNGTKVSDLTPLQAMPLAHLNCADTPVAKLPSLKEMKLTQLYCQNTQVSDLSPLKGMKLTNLDCSRTKVVDLSPLKGMPLVNLKCDNTKVRDLTSLKGMPLTSLQCYDTKVSDLTPLNGMALTYLSCAGTPVASLSPLKGMKLTQLYCNNTRVSDLSPLTGMSLTGFSCYNTQVSDLSPLTGMRLTSLQCYNTKVHDLTPLKGMPLAVLMCTATKVRDLTPLKGMALTALYCSGTDVASLAPLAGMKLTTLDCTNTKVSDLAPLKGMPLTGLSFQGSPVSSPSPLRAITTLQHINGMPAAAFWKEVEAKQKAKKP